MIELDPEGARPTRASGMRVGRRSRAGGDLDVPSYSDRDRSGGPYRRGDRRHSSALARAGAAGRKRFRRSCDDPCRRSASKGYHGRAVRAERLGAVPPLLHLSGCDGPNSASAVRFKRSPRGHDVADGEAVLILNSSTPRGIEKGDCDKSPGMVFLMRRAEDAYAAQRALAEARHRCNADRIAGLWGWRDRCIASCPSRRYPEA